MNCKMISAKSLALFSGALLFAGIAAPDMFGQGTRRKRNPSTPVNTVPLSTAGEAQIISRAEDFPDTAVLPKVEDKKVEPVADPNSSMIADLKARVAGLESAGRKDPDEKQKRLLLNLDILNRAEQRSESLRKQLFDLMEKENTIKTRLDLIEMNLRPEAIDREVAFAGSLRPEDLRALKKKQLEIERTNLQALMTEVQKSRTLLDQNLQKSDLLVEKLRQKLEKEIDDALGEQPNN